MRTAEYRNASLDAFRPYVAPDEPREVRRTGLRTILFMDGTVGRYVVYSYGGPCIVGQATAYVYRNNNLVWVKPGESVDWLEVEE